VHCGLGSIWALLFLFRDIPRISTAFISGSTGEMTRIGVVVSALLLFAVASVAAEEQYTTSDFSTTSDVSRMEFQTCSG
jgi:hypothetical protein